MLVVLALISKYSFFVCIGKEFKKSSLSSLFNFVRVLAAHQLHVVSKISILVAFVRWSLLIRAFEYKGFTE